MKKEDLQASGRTCRTYAGKTLEFRQQLPELVDEILKNGNVPPDHHHITYEPIPTRESVIEILQLMREILFPGFFSPEKVDPVNLRYSMGRSVSMVYDLLCDQVCRSLRHDCFRYDQACSDCEGRAGEIALEVIRAIPGIQKLMAADVAAAYEGDPAAKSYDEIIFCYPGIYAIWVYRVAHQLYRHGVPLLPRIMTEHAHSLTGIDIHPGAQIGRRFVIDHGTGVVIGETTEIGENVRIYQGVTLGALSLPPEVVNDLRYKKRHPTIEDNVIIYSGATILGGETVIGANSTIGGSVWLTESIPPNTRVMLETPKLVYK
jgi:serine O-acetyltransferase